MRVMRVILRDCAKFCVLAVALSAGAFCIFTGCGGVMQGKASAPEPPASTRSTRRTGANNMHQALQPYTFRQMHMAMPVEITLWAPSGEMAESAAKAAFAKVARVDRLMNDYLPESEISRLSDHAGKGPMRVSDEMLEVLVHAQRMHELTGGAFDPTAAPVILLWREAIKTKKLPDVAALTTARRLVGMDKVKIDLEARTAELLEAGMRLDFGGIAKGHACDLATDELLRHGVTISSVQAGGDMVLGDSPPGERGWEIDIPGREPMVLANTAASISGDTSRFVIIDGARYSHVVDPRTGMGVTSRRMAVVLGPRGIDTDPLSTAGCIMPRGEFEALIAKMGGFRALVFTAPDDE